MTISAETAVAGPYNGDGSTTAFTFAFKCFSASEVAVYVESSAGVQTVQTLTTHYSVSLNSDQDTSPGGTITMVTAPASGEKLHIVSDAPFTRTDYFANASGFYPNVLNDARDKTTLQIQQLKDQLARSALVPIGETIGVVPGQSARAGKYFGFDSNGDPVALDLVNTGVSLTLGTGWAAALADPLLSDEQYIVVDTYSELQNLEGADVEDVVNLLGARGGVFRWDTSDLSTEVGADEVTSGQGDGGIYVAPATDRTGASGAWVREFTGPVHVTWYGAVGDGSTDSTNAIEAAWGYCLDSAQGYFAEVSGEISIYDINGPSLYFGPGAFVYNGTGLTIPEPDQAIFRIYGDGQRQTRIQIADNVFFIDIDDRYIYGLTIEDIHFEGGYGTFRNSSTAIQVSTQHIVRNCTFSQYTKCAIGHNSVDMPHWRFENCIFRGDETTIGVALQGLANQTAFINCNFKTNLYDVKLGYGGADVLFLNCAFVWFDAYDSTDRHNIWIVPDATGSKKGPTVRDCKFGNENMGATEYRFLFADEGTTVTGFEDTPHSTSASTGFIEGVTIENCQFGGVSGYSRAYITSYTPNVRWMDWERNHFLGTYSSGGIISFPLGGLIEDRNRGGIYNVGASNGVVNKVHPDVNYFHVIDPLAVHGGEMDVPNYYNAGGADHSYVDLLSSNDVTSDGTLSNATRSSITDATGGSNAIELTVTAASGFLSLPETSPSLTANSLAWIEFDVKKSSTNPLSVIQVDVWDFPRSNVAWRRVLTLPDDWKRVRVPWVPTLDTHTSIQLRFYDNGNYSSGVAERFKIGRPKIYHASEPINYGRLAGNVTQTTVGSAGAATALPANPTGYQTILIDGTEYVMPYYAKS